MFTAVKLHGHTVAPVALCLSPRGGFRGDMTQPKIVSTVFQCQPR